MHEFFCRIEPVSLIAQPYSKMKASDEFNDAKRIRDDARMVEDRQVFFGRWLASEAWRNPTMILNEDVGFSLLPPRESLLFNILK